jgi:hypothetical protein
MKEIKNCPFCGHDHDSGRGGSTDYVISTEYGNDDEVRGTAITCRGCNIMVSIRAKESDSRFADAIQTYNKRSRE